MYKVAPLTVALDPSTNSSTMYKMKSIHFESDPGDVEKISLKQTEMITRVEAFMSRLTAHVRGFGLSEELFYHCGKTNTAKSHQHSGGRTELASTPKW